MLDDKHKAILEQHPYLTFLTYGGNDYIGVIQNVDDVITTIYDFAVLRSEEQKIQYLQLAEVWYWESNRLVPINVFLKQEWAVFRPTLKTFNSKDVDIKTGPCVSLKEMSLKRSKRRSITLVRKIV
jgi:hypothetical protein